MVSKPIWINAILGLLYSVNSNLATATRDINSVWELESVSEQTVRRRFQKLISKDLELQDGTGYGYKLSLNNDELKAAVEVHSNTDSRAMISMLKVSVRTARRHLALIDEEKKMQK